MNKVQMNDFSGKHFLSNIFQFALKINTGQKIDNVNAYAFPTAYISPKANFCCFYLNRYFNSTSLYYCYVLLVPSRMFGSIVIVTDCTIYYIHLPGCLSFVHCNY